MTVVVDTSFVLALGSRDDANHAAALAWIQGIDEDLVTSPLIVAEMDELVAERLGAAGSTALWRDLEAGVYTVRWWADALAESLAIARRGTAAGPLGLADASLVALANRLNTRRVATFDHDTFRSLMTPGGEPFAVLPADA